MSFLDGCVLAITLAAIVGYGIWKTHGAKQASSFLRGGSDARWYTIGLSIMATQASAITFLSTPGQGFENGMGFVQFYFGLPIAMVILCATILPIFYRSRVFTAYEYLERRFDLKTRQLTALIFLIQRGVGAGVSLYAPAIILSTLLGWTLTATNVAIGTLVILYTVSGGTRAVNQTQQYQMTVMLGGMALACVYIVSKLPAQMSLPDAVAVAGAFGKLKAVDFSVKLNSRYTFWSGITGGLFVQLAYFGTDQSQVQRYLSGESLTQSRLGLIFNALLKIPMQFLILFVGVLVFVFFQLERPPVVFNSAAWRRVQQLSPQSARSIEARHAAAFEEKRALLTNWISSRHSDPQSAAALEPRLHEAAARELRVRDEARALVTRAEPKMAKSDSDYVFLRFVMEHFPSGLIGLLIAVVLCAAMSANASALNALGTTSTIDFFKRSFRPNATDAELVLATRIFTAGWGLFAIGFALFASQLDNLIQAVNILGSIFYGPMLGIFVVAFFLRSVDATAVFVAAVLAQLTVFAVFAFSEIGFLWYNVIGCAVVVGAAVLASRLWPAPPARSAVSE